MFWVFKSMHRVRKDTVHECVQVSHQLVESNHGQSAFKGILT